ncbi:MAG: ABC transporter substrate-binding protein [Deltaproteobacteria bacterium]|nr:ABC transporter substrate-binding protein [Deltaproteobacteria bacterium]MBW2343779.1 ABC transporter substrate-binding protein [Deltaproteobacteria bacterium]
MAKGRIILFLVLFLFVTVDVRGDDRPLKKISFVPQWVPQAQFAGYYLAHERGIFKKYGIDLTIIPGGPDNPPLDLLKNGKADFVTLWLSTGIQMRAKGVKLINIAQMMQRSALMLIAKKSSGVKTPRDMNGKKVGLWGPIFQIQPRAFFKRYNLKVKEIRQSYSVNLFLRDGVDVTSAMWYNEYHTIINSGLNPDELTTFFFHEHGLNFPEDGIYILEETFQKDPDLCKAFVKASIEGWRYAFAHPEEALGIVMKNLKDAHIPATLVHQKWMLERMKDLMLPQDARNSVGRLLAEDYNRVARGLLNNGLIKEIPDHTSFYRKCTPHVEK